MSSDRKKPGMAFWATVVAAFLIVYVASIGPANWMLSWTIPASDEAYDVFVTVYAPLRCLADKSDVLSRAMWNYMWLFSPDKPPDHIDY